MTETAAPPAEAAPAAAPESPYKGLVPYGEDDSAFFFGRESERRIIAANLLASRLTLLYGPSGVGKTSLLLAGVVHDLRAAARRDLAARGEAEYAVVVFRSWRDDPVAGLAAAVAEAARERPGGDGGPVPAGPLADVLEEWTRRLDAELLVVLDQFEEYFLYHEREDGPGSFAEEFPRAVNRAGLRASFLVSVREDELAKLDRFKGRIPGLFDNYLRVEHLGEDAARAAVVEPLARWAAATGKRIGIESALVDEVLSQVQTGAVEVGQTGGGTAAGAPAGPRRFEAAYLQLVLTRLWDEERAAGSHELRLAALRRLGGAQQIVDDRLVEAVRALPPGEEATAARIFHFLVSKSGTKIALSAADLAEFAAVPEPAVAAVLEGLAAQRILRPIAPPAGAATGTRYELFHDKLAPAVLGWRARYADGQARLEAEELARRQAARARRYRTFAGLVGAAAFGVAVLAGWAVTQQRAANDQKKAARAQGLAASALAELAIDPQVAVLLARDSLGVHRTAEGENALRQALPEARMRVLLQPSDGVSDAVFVPGGRLVVTVGARGADVWDARTGRRLRTLPGRGGDVAVSADGRYAATFGSRGGAVSSIATGRVATRLPPASLAAFAPGSDRLAIYDGKGIELWALRGRVALLGAVAEPAALAWSPDGRLLAAGRRDDTVALYDAAPLRLLRSLGTPSELAATTSVAFSRDGRLVAAASDSGVARVWRTATGELAARLRGHQAAIRDLAFSGHSDRVVTASDDGTARIWNARTGATIAELRGHTGPVREASFSQGGKFVVTAGDTTARVWDAQTGRLVAILRGDTDFVTAAAFGDDGHSVVTASADGTARIWDATAGGVVFGGHSDRVYSVDVSRDGKRVVTGSRDGTARVWELSTGRELYPPTDGAGSVRQAVFDPRGDGLVLASGSGLVFAGFPPPLGAASALGAALKAIRPRAGAVTSVAAGPRDAVAVGAGREVDLVTADDDVQPLGRHASVVRAVAFSPDGGMLASGSKDGTARLWDVRSRRLVHVLDAHAGPVDGVAWSPGGARLVTAQGRASAIVWDARSGRRLLELRHPGGVVVTSVAYSPDGHLVATGASDRLVRVFDALRGDLVAELAGHTGVVWSVRFTPGGGAIVSASRDGTARVWPAAVFAPYSGLLREADAQVAHGVTPDERSAFRQLAAAQT